MDCKQVFRWVSRLKKTYQPVEGFPDKIDPERVRGFERILDTILGHCGDVAGKSVLDIGSNLGYFCLELARGGAHTLGIERDVRRTEVSQCLAEKNGLSNARFSNEDAMDFVENVATDFDYVILLNVFHHILVQDETRGWAIFNKLLNISDGVFVMMRNSMKDWTLCRAKASIGRAILESSDATDYVAYPAVHGRVIYFFYKQS